MGYKVAIVGATGNVGREMLEILAERKFPIDELVPLASSRSVGREVSFGDKVLKCKNLDDFDFTGTDFVLMSAGGDISKQWAPKIGAAGAIVIDNSSAFRYHEDVPLVVPEVNADVLDAYMAKNDRKNIIANPNCSTAQLVVALKPLHELATIKRIVVSTYQSVSGGGKDAMDELWNQTKGIFVNDSATPVFVGHAEAVHMEFAKPITPDEARDALREAPGVSVLDKREDGGYITPVEAKGDDATFVSRIREDVTVENGLAMWVVSDNLRKGAALNTIQIAEALVERGLVQPKAAA